MIELVLAIFVIPKIISPLAIAKKRSGIRWILLAIGVFLITEILTVAIYFFTYALLVKFFHWQQDVYQFWLTKLVYKMALIGGFGSIEIIRR
ncbi:MAG TPA: hypothetical protein VNI84_10985 [Pyrinomonadaceae bacterium]|nr:hypothetical protein [Pyrinomonadaceae bacterium]